jgi:putative tricarboxylic transport membrane protein
MRLHDTLLGLLFMAAAAVYFAHALGFPDMPGQKYGPALFPQVIAVGIFACGAVMAWRGWRMRQALQEQGNKPAWFTWDETWSSPRALASWLAVPVAVGAYLLLADKLGFLPTAALLVGALAAWLGAGWRSALVLGVVSSGVIHWFFASVMRVPLPRGWFMQLLFEG